MVTRFDGKFDDVSERGFTELERRMAGLPQALADTFWERFFTDIQQAPDKLDLLRAVLDGGVEQ